MKSSLKFGARFLLVALMLCGGLRSWGQDSVQSPSLGDIARKSRKEHASGSHVPARQVVNEEEDGPDPGGVWRLHVCSYLPCVDLAVSLPRTLQWTRPATQPRPVLISLKGQEEDPGRVIRIYAADMLSGTSNIARYYQDVARRTLLQELFARPDYFGQAARFVLDERVQIGSYPATITHFTVASGAFKYRGLSIVSTSTSGSLGFACVYREEDTKEAASICDGIIKSARIEAQQQYRPQVRTEYPYEPPVYYPRVDDPREDDPEDPE
jgi:hypothetical protein